MPEAAQTSSGSWWKDILGSVDAIAATYKNVSDAIDANSSTRRESATPAAAAVPVAAASQDNTMKYIIMGGVVIAAIVGIALIVRR